MPAPLGLWQPAQAAIDPVRNPNIAVVEKDYGQGDGFVDEQLRNGESNQRQHEEACEEGEKEFDRVETHTGTGIHLRIGMVDRVKAPQQRHAMIEAMPPILPAIEQDDASAPVQPGGQVY